MKDKLNPNQDKIREVSGKVYKMLIEKTTHMVTQL